MRPVIGALSAVLLISSCLAAPQDKAADGGLTDLIKDVFQPGNNPPEGVKRQNIETTTQNLDDIIDQVFNPPSNNNNNNNNNNNQPSGNNGGGFPGGNTGNNGANFPGGNTGNNGGSFPGGNTGNNGGSFPGGNTGNNGGSFPGGNTGNNGGSFPGGNTGNNGGNFPGGNTGNNGGTIDINGGNFPGGDQDGCECVPYYQCQNGSITENGAGIIDIRVQSECQDYLEVCCTPPNRIPGQDVNIPTVRPPSQRKGCGQRNPEGVGFRITGTRDNEAQFGEFPWMVAILKEEGVGKNGEALNVYQCGGALIHPQIVLTAAHCIYGKNPSILKIRAGEWDTQTKNEVLPHQDRLVRNVITHEQYHKGALYNDFGLLILVDPVDLTNENVGVVCLPEPTDNFDYSRCFASGWGKDIFGREGHYQVILKRVELPVVPNAQCQSALRTTRLGKYFQLHGSFICAGGEAGKDTCKGDGGSPLVCPMRSNPDKYAQAGIVAWGIGCGENQVPGVYANVAIGRNWINQQAQYAGINLNEYQSI